MAKIVKMCDMNQDIAIEVFSKLNPEKIEIQKEYLLGLMKIVRIYTNVEPKDLIYPEGWYMQKELFVISIHLVQAYIMRYVCIKLQASHGINMRNIAH